MGDNLWDLNEVPPEKNRALSAKEREFLMTEDSGSYTTADIERRVSEKAEELPDRVQQLVEDICLLYYRGFVGTAETTHIWEELLSSKTRSQLVREQPISPDIERSEAAFGFEIASVLRFLRNDPGSLPSDLLWGMIVGLVGESTEKWETEGTNLVQVFDELKTRHDRRLFATGIEYHDDDGLSDLRQKIRELLQEQGFAPAPPLIDAVRWELFGASELLDDLDPSWTVDPAQTEIPEPPDEQPSTAEAQRHELERIISGLDNQTCLRSLDNLAKDVLRDAVRIQNKDVRGADGDKAFRFVAQNERMVHKDDVHKEILKGKRNSTTALHRLSGNSSWVTRPVIEEDGDAHWKITSYGELVYEVLFTHNCSVNWMYNYIVNPEELSEDQHELITELV